MTAFRATTCLFRPSSSASRVLSFVLSTSTLGMRTIQTPFGFPAADSATASTSAAAEAPEPFLLPGPFSSSLLSGSASSFSSSSSFFFSFAFSSSFFFSFAFSSTTVFSASPASSAAAATFSLAVFPSSKTSSPAATGCSSVCVVIFADVP